MARLFLGACWCRHCGYVTERPDRPNGLDTRALPLDDRPPARWERQEGLRCPWCKDLLAAVTLKDIRFEEAVLDASVRFLGIRRADLAEGWANVWIGDEPRCEFRPRTFCPVAFVKVREDWMNKVHARNLDRLPAIYLRIGETEHYNRKPIFVLDIGQPYYLDDHDAWLAEATWSEGGRTIRSGHLAWADRRPGDHTKGPLMYAVSTTEKRALKTLRERLAALRKADDYAADVRRREAADLALLGDLQL